MGLKNGRQVQRVLLRAVRTIIRPGVPKAVRLCGQCV